MPPGTVITPAFTMGSTESRHTRVGGVGLGQCIPRANSASNLSTNMIGNFRSGSSRRVSVFMSFKWGGMLEAKVKACAVWPKAA